MLKVFTLEQTKQWDPVVHSFKDYDTYWLNGYVKGFHIHGHGDPLLFYYEDKAVRGINVVMKRDIAKEISFAGKIPENRYFDFATPYGYGGWLIEGKHTKELFKVYETWCHHNGIISEFVRFHPVINNHIICKDFYKVVQFGEVVHMDITSPEVIWRNIVSKNRNVIRKAIRNGVKVYNGRFHEMYEKFQIIYDDTMNRVNAEKYYYFSKLFYESVLKDLAQHAQIFYAMKDDKVLAASIVLAANKMMNYHLSGRTREYSNLASTSLLLYKAALWGCENGYKTFYLGGGVGSGKDGLFKFKKAFNKEGLTHFFIGKKVFDLEKYDEICSLRKDITENKYFPKYRTKG